VSEVPDFDAVLVEVEDGVARVVLNRPEQRNSLSSGMLRDLLAALTWCREAEEVRVVVLTGAGDRAFSAGADIHEFSASVRRGTTTAVRDFVRRGQGMTARLEAFGKPVIAAVNGIGKTPAICAPGGRRRSFPRKI